VKFRRSPSPSTKTCGLSGLPFPMPHNHQYNPYVTGCVLYCVCVCVCVWCGVRFVQHCILFCVVQGLGVCVRALWPCLRGKYTVWRALFVHAACTAVCLGLQPLRWDVCLSLNTLRSPSTRVATRPRPPPLPLDYMGSAATANLIPIVLFFYFLFPTKKRVPFGMCRTRANQDCFILWNALWLFNPPYPIWSMKNRNG